MAFIRSLTLALLMLFGMPAPAATPPRSPAVQCNGCTGAGDLNSVSGGSCDGFVSIVVDVQSGKCKWFFSPDWMLSCRQVVGCSVQVDRSWSGLDSGMALDFCVSIGGETLCVDPKPVVDGTGQGSDSRPSPDLACQSGASRTFSVGAPACGLSTSVSASCSSCVGVLPGGG